MAHILGIFPVKCQDHHREGKQSRGRGTGSELLQQAETLALILGLRYLKTDTYALNEKAQQLFLKHGYHFCGEIQFRKMEHQFYCYEKVL